MVLLIASNVYAENKSVPLTDDAFYVMVTIAANDGVNCSLDKTSDLLEKKIKPGELKKQIQACIKEKFEQYNWKYIQ
jgi:hypothetical protein